MKKKVILLSTLFFIFGIVIFFCLNFRFYKKEPNSNNIVNIVFTTDSNYKDYLKTTIRTAIASKNKDSVYNINILCVDLSQKDCDIYKKFAGKNVTINTKKVSLESIKEVGNYEISYNVTRADLFKFFMPDLFPDLDKILYIDVDTAIVKDITELYNIDLKNKYIGAVNKIIKDVDVEFKSDGKPHYKKVRKYNCGVLLYNLKLWRQSNIKDKLIKAKNIDEDRELMTQNIFNKVLDQSKIMQLPPIYNLLVQWRDIRINKYIFALRYLPYCANHNCEYKNLLSNAVIIHYADNTKPWKYRDNKVSKYWLMYENKEDYNK